VKENSIEEALEKLSNGKKIKMYELLRTFKREGIENFVITRKKYVDVILSAYKRVLKENEELKKSKITYERVRNIQIENKEIVNKKYISKQKIKEVIKELEENIYRIKKQYSNGGENCNTVYLENLAQVKILKQMLRESEE
jgi:hypothetical protein